jgi:hypothetical protein
MHYFEAGNLKTNTLIMKKEKIKMEYMLKGGSENIIWSIISTPSGLETWFADKVIAKEKTFTFQWGKTETRQAELISCRTNNFIRFHWLDEAPKTYFELRINVSELTKAHVLEITEISRNEEEEDLTQMWESQIEELRRVAGM